MKKQQQQQQQQQPEKRGEMKSLRKKTSTQTKGCVSLPK